MRALRSMPGYLDLPAYDAVRRLRNKERIVRTLDMRTPRVVSQTPYEAIRADDMCIVDFTGWRPNVFFELGVRLACSRQDPVCIIDKQRGMSSKETFEITAEDMPGVKRAWSVPTEQCRRLEELFEPLEYSEGDATIGELMARYRRPAEYADRELMEAADLSQSTDSKARNVVLFAGQPADCSGRAAEIERAPAGGLVLPGRSLLTELEQRT